MDPNNIPAPSIHQYYMRLALEQAKKSPPRPSNFRVGAILFDVASNQILATGFTLELPGNTHAEQCCLQKYANAHNLPEGHIGQVLPKSTILYTTMEPCNLRASGNLPCVDRIISTQIEGKWGIRKVYVGVKEPEKFVGENQGRAKLEAHGIESIPVPGFEDEILKIATAGHKEGV